MEFLKFVIYFFMIVGVGKSSLILNYISEADPADIAPTIGASFFTVKMKLDEGKVKMQVNALLDITIGLVT